MAVPAHLASIIGGLQAQSDFVLGTVLPNIQEKQAEFLTAANIQQDAIARSGAAAQAVTADKQRQQAALEDRLVQLGETMMPDDLRYQNAKAIQQANSELAGSLQRVQELESVDFFSNPLGYVVSSAQLPKASTKLAQSMQSVDILTSQQQKIAAATTAEAAAMRATARTITDVGRAAELEGIKAAADQEIARTKMEVAKNNMTHQMQLMQLDAAHREPLERAYVMERDEQRWQAQYTLQKQAAERAAREFAEKDAEDKMILKMRDVAIRQATTVGDKTTADILGSMTSAAQLKAMKLNPTLWERFGTYYETGSASELTGRKVIGTDILTSVDRATRLGLPLSPGEQEVASVVRVAQAKILQDPQWASLSEPEKRAKVLAQATADVAAMPIKSPRTLITAEASGADPFQNSPLFTKTALKNDPEAFKDWDSLLSATAAAVKAGDINPVEASREFSKWAARGRLMTNLDRNYEGMGIAVAPKQVLVQVGTQVIDAADPMQVAGAILKQARPGLLTERLYRMGAAVAPTTTAIVSAATRRLTPEQVAELERQIREYRTQNPDATTFPIGKNN